MYRVIQRLSCAGCDVTPNRAAEAKMEALFKQLNGKVGFCSDKSIELIFANKTDAERFEKFGTDVGAIFDDPEEYS